MNDQFSKSDDLKVCYVIVIGLVIIAYHQIVLLLSALYNSDYKVLSKMHKMKPGRTELLF